MMFLKAFEVGIIQPPSILTYELGAEFFELFEHSLLEQCELIAKVKIDSRHDRLRFLFSITGTIELLCDRSLETFSYPIDIIEEKINFVLGDEDKELSTELYVLGQETATINIAQHIYDFVNLTVPMKKLHPRFLNS